MTAIEDDYGMTEVKMTIGNKGKMIISVSCGDKHLPVGEMRMIQGKPQFTSTGMQLWLTPEIIDGIALLIRQSAEKLLEDMANLNPGELH